MNGLCDIAFSAGADGAVSVGGRGVTAAGFTEIACGLGPIGTEDGDVCVEMCAWGCASAAAMWEEATAGACGLEWGKS